MGPQMGEHWFPTLLVMRAGLESSLSAALCFSSPDTCNYSSLVLTSHQLHLQPPKKIKEKTAAFKNDQKSNADGFLVLLWRDVSNVLSACASLTCRRMCWQPLSAARREGFTNDIAVALFLSLTPPFLARFQERTRTLVELLVSVARGSRPIWTKTFTRNKTKTIRVVVFLIWSLFLLHIQKQHDLIQSLGFLLNQFYARSLALHVCGRCIMRAPLLSLYSGVFSPVWNLDACVFTQRTFLKNETKSIFFMHKHTVNLHPDGICASHSNNCTTHPPPCVCARVLERRTERACPFSALWNRCVLSVTVTFADVFHYLSFFIYYNFF